MNFFNFSNTYFHLSLGLSLLITLSGNQQISPYGLLMFMLTTCPVFAFLYFSNFYDFSNLISFKRPDLYKKYKVSTGWKDGINGFDLFNNDDFEKLEDTELIELLKRTKHMLFMTLKAFITLILYAIFIAVFRF